MEQFDPTPREENNTTRKELKELKQKITGSIDENLSEGTDDRTHSLRNNLNPYRTEYGAGIYKNPRW